MLAIAYRPRNVPRVLMNLTLNNGIAEHKRENKDLRELNSLNPTKKPNRFETDSLRRRLLAAFARRSSKALAAFTQ